MKIVLSILSILTMLAIYSTGAFVPESQGMADTVAGLKVLSNAEMAQQMGGIDNHSRRLTRMGHNSPVSWCHTHWDLSCYPDFEVNYTNSLFDCIWCATSLTNFGAYRIEYGAVLSGRSGCNYSQGNCKPWNQENKGNNCTDYVTQYCIP